MIKEQVLAVLADIAPDADTSGLDPEQSFRDQLDLDSMDFLSLVLGLEKRFGVKIPEVDYPRLSSLNGCLDYLGHG